MRWGTVKRFSILPVKIYVSLCMCARFGSHSTFWILWDHIGCMEFFLGESLFEYTTYSHHIIPFQRICVCGIDAIATITIKIAHICCWESSIPLSTRSFNVLLSDGLVCPILSHNFTEKGTKGRENDEKNERAIEWRDSVRVCARMCMFYVFYSSHRISLCLAARSLPWYICCSHVHINNVYRNLRAMLTSTFPLRLRRIFVLFFAFPFFPHWLCHQRWWCCCFCSSVSCHFHTTFHTPTHALSFSIQKKKNGDTDFQRKKVQRWSSWRKFISFISCRIKISDRVNTCDRMEMARVGFLTVHWWSKWGWIFHFDFSLFLRS